MCDADKHGLVMVITGNGKGKTTSAFGQALRAIGHGYKVFIIQFMKHEKSGEVLAMEKYLPGITIAQFGSGDFVAKDSPAAKDIDLAGRGMEKASEAVQSNEYDMIILDEINVAINFGLIHEKDVINLIKNKTHEVSLVLTGRYASDEIIKIADMVSEIDEVKHHYNAGIKEQAGIEF